MPYRAVMKMPIRAFWLMSGNIRRLRAESDLRNVTVAVVSGCESVDEIKNYQERLILEMGVVVKSPIGADIDRDESGFAELKAIAELM